MIIECESGCGSPVEAYVRSVLTVHGKMEQRVICMGCEFVQSEEYSKEILSPDYKEPIYHGMGWCFPNESGYEEWKKVLSHDCRVGEDQYRVEILPITFFERSHYTAVKA